MQLSQKAWVRVLTLDLAEPGLLRDVAEDTRSEGKTAENPDSASLLTDSLLPQASLRTDYAGSLLDEDLDYNDLDSISEAVHDESDFPAGDSDQGSVESSVESSVVDSMDGAMDGSGAESLGEGDTETITPSSDESSDDSANDSVNDSVNDSANDSTNDSVNDSDTDFSSSTEEAPQPVRMYKPHRSRSPPRNMHPEERSPPEPVKYVPSSVLRLASQRREAKVSIPVGAHVIDITGKTSEEVGRLLDKGRKKAPVLRNDLRIDLPPELTATPKPDEPARTVIDLLNSGDAPTQIENQPVSSASDLFAGICGVAPATQAVDDQMPGLLRVQPRVLRPVEVPGGLDALPTTPVQFPGLAKKEPIPEPKATPGAPVKVPVNPAKTPKAAAKPAKTERVVVKPAKTERVVVKPAKPLKPAKTVVKTAVKTAVKTVKPTVKPAAKKTKKAKPVVPVVPVKTVRANEVQPVASVKVAYTPVQEVPVLATVTEKELFGLMTVSHEVVLARLQSMLQQYCTLCYNGKATLIVALAIPFHP